MPTSRTLAVAGLAVLVAVGVAALWFARRSGGTDGAVIDDGPAASERPPGLLAARPADAQGDGNPAAPPSGAAPAAAAPSPPPRPMKTPFRVRVVCSDPSGLAGARVTVLGHHDRGRIRPLGDPMPLGPDGTVAVDVDELLSSGMFHGFVARVTHPEYPTVEEELYVDPDTRDAAAAALAKGVELRLMKLCTLDGIVVDADGKPVAASVQALFDEETGAEGARTFGEGVVAGTDGRFRIAIRGEGPALLAAAVGGLKPASMPVRLIPGASWSVGTIELSRGSSLAGRVAAADAEPAAAVVVATWAGRSDRGSRPAKTGYLWIEDGRAVWSQLEGAVDASGRFRVDGLERGPYRLRVSSRPEVDVVARAPDESLQLTPK